MRPMHLMRLALLIGVSSPALSQSSVTVYGKLDIGARKGIGVSQNDIATSGDSRLGFRGVEDLGGGLKAHFGFEHRFSPDTGAQDGAQFWKGYSVVGLQGAFGKVSLGRQYTAAFSLVQNQVDPFGGDTVAQVRDVAMRVGGITKVRVDGSIRYDYSVSGLTFAASLAESHKNGGPDRPISAALSYREGPLFLAAGIENPAGKDDEQWNLAAAYTWSDTTLSLGLSQGTNNAGLTAKGVALGLNVPVGQGEFKAAYGQQQVDGNTTVRKIGVGYHHNLSKRTLIYADVGHDTKQLADKTGYDIGIRHLF